MSSSARLRFISHTHLELYVQEIRHGLGWSFNAAFDCHPGDGTLTAKREGHTLAVLPISIRGYGSIIVLEVIIPDRESRSTDYIKAKLKEATNRVHTI